MVEGKTLVEMYDRAYGHISLKVQRAIVVFSAERWQSIVLAIGLIVIGFLGTRVWQLGDVEANTYARLLEIRTAQDEIYDSLGDIRGRLERIQSNRFRAEDWAAAKLWIEERLDSIGSHLSRSDEERKLIRQIIRELPPDKTEKQIAENTAGVAVIKAENAELKKEFQAFKDREQQ